MAEGTTIHVQRCLDRLRQGDPAARNELLEAACNRLTRLSQKMLRADGRVQRWEEADDLLQNAMVRLCRALTDVTPATPREFFRLAALQIRRELIDMARHHFGPRGHGAKHETLGPQVDNEARQTPYDAADATHEPAGLAAWGEFHQKVETLPDQEREAFELVWYQGLTHAEVAALLEVSTKSVQRRWQSACLKLHEALGGGLPGL
jgi:RNA polymerase sigma factor (sigma-70 family)